MECSRGKEAVGLLERLFGREGALIYANASDDAVRALIEGERAFNKTFLRYVHKTYGPHVVSQYFRDYSWADSENPFIYLSQVIKRVEESSYEEENNSRSEQVCVA